MLRSLKLPIMLSAHPKRDTSEVSDFIFCFPNQRFVSFPWHNVEHVGFIFPEILAYTSAVRPRADVQYCLHALARRLAKTRNWTVMFSKFPLCCR